MRGQAFARWGGGLENGKGTVTTDGGALLKTPFCPASQLGESPGATPEELLAAAHAVSFSLALVRELGALEIEPHSIHTTVTVTPARQAQDGSAAQLHVDVSARVPGVDPLDFERAAGNARNAWQTSLPFTGRLSFRVNLNAW